MIRLLFFLKNNHSALYSAWTLRQVQHYILVTDLNVTDFYLNGTEYTAQNKNCILNRKKPELMFPAYKAEKKSPTQTRKTSVSHFLKMTRHNSSHF